MKQYAEPILVLEGEVEAFDEERSIGVLPHPNGLEHVALLAVAFKAFPQLVGINLSVVAAPRVRFHGDGQGEGYTLG